MDSEPIGHETLTIGVGATPLTYAAYAPGGNVADRAVLTCAAADMRFWYDGTAPTATIGHALLNGGTFVLESKAAIVGFRGIRSGGTDAVVSVTYERKI